MSATPEQTKMVTKFSNPNSLGFRKGEYVYFNEDPNQQPYIVLDIEKRVVGKCGEADKIFREFYNLENGTSVNCVVRVKRVDVGLKYDNDDVENNDIDAVFLSKLDPVTLSSKLLELNKKISRAIKLSKVFSKTLEIINS